MDKKDIIFDKRRLHEFEIIRAETDVYFNANYTQELGYSTVGLVIAQNQTEALRLWYLHATNERGYDISPQIKSENGWTVTKEITDDRWINGSDLPHTELHGNFIRVVSFEAVEYCTKEDRHNG